LWLGIVQGGRFFFWFHPPVIFVEPTHAAALANVPDYLAKRGSNISFGQMKTQARMARGYKTLPGMPTGLILAGINLD